MKEKNIFLAGILLLLCALSVGCQNSGRTSGGGWAGVFASKESKRQAAEKEVQELIVESEKSMQSKMYADARGGYMKVLAFYDEHPEVKRSEYPYSRLGMICEGLKLYDQAEEYYLQALKINDQSAETYNNLGYCMYVQKKYPEAIKYMEKAVELSPAEAKYHNNLGLAYGGSENYAKAYEHFCKAMPEADACYNMHTVFASQGKEDKARMALQRALVLNPGHKNATNMLATYEAQERYPQFQHYPNDFQRMQPGGMVDYRESLPALATDMTPASVSAQYGSGYRPPAGGQQPVNNVSYQQPPAGYGGYGR